MVSRYFRRGETTNTNTAIHAATVASFSGADIRHNHANTVLAPHQTPCLAQPGPGKRTQDQAPGVEISEGRVSLVQWAAVARQTQARTQLALSSEDTSVNTSY